jgi:hypothetical protein
VTCHTRLTVDAAVKAAAAGAAVTQLPEGCTPSSPTPEPWWFVPERVWATDTSDAFKQTIPLPTPAPSLELSVAAAGGADRAK